MPCPEVLSVVKFLITCCGSLGDVGHSLARENNPDRTKRRGRSRISTTQRGRGRELVEGKENQIGISDLNEEHASFFPSFFFSFFLLCTISSNPFLI